MKTADPLPQPSNSSLPAAHAGIGPLDPLQLHFGEATTDPFADLLPPSAGDRVSRRAEHVPNVGTNDILSELPSVRAPVPSSAQRPTAASPLKNEQGANPVPGPFPAAPSIEEPRSVPTVPDQIWDDLVRLAPRTPSVERPPAPLRSNFDAFAEPSAGSRNPEDPLAEFARDAIALESFDQLDTPIEQLFTDTPAQDPREQDIIPDPHATTPDPLAGQDTVDPMLVFDNAEAKLRASSDAVFNRPESDQVPELEAFFRPAEPHFESPRAASALLDAAPTQNPTEIVPRPTRSAEAGALGLASLEAYVTLPDAPPPLVAPPTVAPVESAAPTCPAMDVSISPLPRARSGEELLHEFLAGAGIPGATVKEGLTPEMMRRIGAMLSAAVQGTIELIATRALLKREVKADVTIIASTRNNPLKFLPDAESALLQMFGSRIPGFMAPVEAMEDAFRDLRAHEVGLIAGMHAALAQVLQRFSPEALEKRLKPPGMLESLLPNSHQARLWESFEEMYVHISREAQDDFQSLFGKAFLEAYESEISRLKGK